MRNFLIIYPNDVDVRLKMKKDHDRQKELGAIIKMNVTNCFTTLRKRTTDDSGDPANNTDKTYYKTASRVDQKFYGNLKFYSVRGYGNLESPHYENIQARMR